MLRALGGRRNGQAPLRVRAVAALTVLGLLVMTAPIVAAPALAALHWLLHLL